MHPIQWVALPAFTDNYIWMLHDGVQAAVVDPGDAAPVLDAIDRLKLRLVGILVTHHHADHVGGVDALRSSLAGPVHAPALERTPEPHVGHQEGDHFELLGHRVDVLDVPGHTAGHIAYVLRRPGLPPVLFCGDTLFSAGCGRLFEGTPGQMKASLAKLVDLGDDTVVCCTHEYTLSNLKFARATEPDNAQAIDHERHCLRLRESQRPTLPSTIGLERQINPFLRTHVPSVAAAARRWSQSNDGQGSGLMGGDVNDPQVQVLAQLREWKNQFR